MLVLKKTSMSSCFVSMLFSLVHFDPPSLCLSLLIYVFHYCCTSENEIKCVSVVDLIFLIC